MRNFLKLGQVDPMPLLGALATQEELWNQYTVRTHHPKSAHRVVDDIILRYNRFDRGDDFVEKVCSEIEVVNYPALARLPAARQLIFPLMFSVQGEHLGRVMISRMAPGVSIPPHSDRIDEAELLFPNKIPPALYYDRYHVALKSEPGCLFICGEEQVYMAPGEVWWFNNQLEHSVVNNSAQDRIHLVCDVRTSFHDCYIPR
jgi:hypothetical protein